MRSSSSSRTMSGQRSGTTSRRTSRSPCRPRRIPDRAFANQGAPGPVGRRMPAPRELDAAMDRHPPGDPRPVPPGGSTEAVDPGTPPRGTTRYSRASVLQDRVLQSDRQPQGEYGARAGLVCEAGGVRAPPDGNWGGAMGHRPRVRGEPRRPEDDGLLGPRGPRLEDATPAVHAAVRRDGPRFPESGDGDGTRPPREKPA